MSNNALLDKEFLKQLDKYPFRKVFAKIILLTSDEYPIREITGSITSGNISIDGKSTVRRTCNLTLNLDQKFTNFTIDLGGKHIKFKLFIGLYNEINQVDYDEIIWFKMGTFVITSINATYNENSYQISIQGKDKMCLLNGDVSGTVIAQTEFGRLWEQVPGTIRYNKTDIPIKTIIKEAIHEYAQEPYHNIVINDLDICGVELMEYKATSNPIYVYTSRPGYPTVEIAQRFITKRSGESNSAYQNRLMQQVQTYNNAVEKENICFEQSVQGQILANYPNVFRESKNVTSYEVDSSGNYFNIKYETERAYQGDDMYVYHNNNTYHIIKRAAQNDTIGFKATDLTYPGELIVKAGASITSMLDSIVKILGEFEYYYNVDGQFIFQRKRIYYDTAWSNATIETESGGVYEPAEYYYDSTAMTSANVYDFVDGNLIVSYQNKLNLSKIKNDYAIWGEITSGSKKYSMHLRTAIDRKPTTYTSLYAALYPEDYESTFGFKQLPEQWQPQANYTFVAHEAGGIYDWRELIYRMAWDSLQLHGKILDLTEQLNKKIGDVLKRNILIELNDCEEAYNKSLNTGYAAYYSDILGFWTDLYRTSREPFITYVYDEGGSAISDSDGNKVESITSSMSESDFKRWAKNGFWNPDIVAWNREKQDSGEMTAYDDQVIIYKPTSLKFWFDFLSPDSDLSPYSIEKIGRRTKIINDTTIKAIFFRDVPNVLFVDTAEDEVEYSDNLHYIRMNIPAGYSNYFQMSAQGKSAKEVLDTAIHDGTFSEDTITLSAVPVYYLEPNTRIKVYDEQTGIVGDYLIKSLSYQFSHDGLMSLSAIKANDRIL